jgi:CspA family cold shock protein
MQRQKRSDDTAREAAGVPAQPLGTQGTTIGIVKYWHTEKGHGAISTDATAPWDIWCHFSQVVGEGFRSLTPGERVEVDYLRIDQDSFRFMATRARRLDQSIGE